MNELKKFSRNITKQLADLSIAELVLWSAAINAELSGKNVDEDVVSALAGAGKNDIDLTLLGGVRDITLFADGDSKASYIKGGKNVDLSNRHFLVAGDDVVALRGAAKINALKRSNACIKLFGELSAPQKVLALKKINQA